MHACSTRRTVCDATTYVYKKEAVLRCELIVPKIMSGAPRGNIQGYLDKGADHLARRFEKFNLDSNKKSQARMKLLHGHEYDEMETQTQRIELRVDAIHVEIEELDLGIKRARRDITACTGDLMFMNGEIDHKKSECSILKEEIRSLEPNQHTSTPGHPAK